MRKLLFVLAGLILIAGIAFLAFSHSASLPPETDAILDEVLQSELPDFYAGTAGKARSGELEIWYESIGDPSGPAVLLISGLGTSATFWQPSFYQSFVDEGYHVIRYDNRGVGLSDWVENWDPQHPYTLEDMAADGVAVLDALGIDKAHVIGISMGGMIAQRIAISHKDRVLSLTSIASSAFVADPELTTPTTSFRLGLVRIGLLYGDPTDARRVIKFRVGVRQISKGDGDYPLDVRYIAQRTLFELRKRRGFNLRAQEQHTAATLSSGSRLEEMSQIEVPTLIVHGSSDPLIPPEHSRKYAPLIPGAELLLIEAMGHELPKVYCDQIVPAVLEVLERGERRRVEGVTDGSPRSVP